jgi:hypothetical protein
MVVSLSTGHVTDPEWQSVENQMERLRSGGYISKLAQNIDGTANWTLTPLGQTRLQALIAVEDTEVLGG